jgi:hypothetical protein
MARKPRFRHLIHPIAAIAGAVRHHRAPTGASRANNESLRPFDWQISFPVARNGGISSSLTPSGVATCWHTTSGARRDPLRCRRTSLSAPSVRVRSGDVGETVCPCQSGYRDRPLIPPLADPGQGGDGPPDVARRLSDYTTPGGAVGYPSALSARSASRQVSW